MTCAVGRCRIVGNADPHPKIWRSKFAIPVCYSSLFILNAIA